MASLSWSVSARVYGMEALTNGCLLDSDFLKHWSKLDCTRLFDSSWVVSNMWIQVDGLTPLHPWTFGDISCQ
jgi:hypothetical protein